MTRPRKDDGFGEHLRALRIEAGLTQAEVADRLRVSESWVGNIERGASSPHIGKVLAYCDGVGAYLHVGFDRPEADYNARPDYQAEPADDIVRRLVDLANGDPGVVERICRDLYVTLANQFTSHAIRDGDRQGEWLSEKIAAYLNDLANFAKDNAFALRRERAARGDE